MPHYVQSALSALRHLQPATRAAAIAILGMWAHVGKIEVDVERVVDYYFAGGTPDPATVCRDSYAEGYLDALNAVKAIRDEQRQADPSPVDILLDETAARWKREQREWLAKVSDCPEWCTLTHNPLDDIEDDLALHLGADHTDSTVRKLLDAHRLEVQVARTDVPSEGRLGTPNLYVRCEVELTTWEQAAELARTILEAFGYLKGADLN